MRSIDNRFYKSREWKAVRAAYLAAHPLCERCQIKGYVVPAQIVHHKIHLTEENVNDPAIAFGKDNLESVCKSCHNQEHFGEKVERRWRYVDGRLETGEK